ncbi:MAG: response regulator with CheY-like receiver domain and winged-helix DNA-binding domain [Pedosphaera sp.]|nr:response regulator with CheY-like receiver domain and winged-helix DNA-binding domain [Pedosphaera sp.]
MSNIPTILYVDDDDNDVLLLKHALRCAKLAFDVQVVNDPEKASAYLSGQGVYSDRERHPWPALVLLDLKMPRMHGLEVLTWIRSQSSLENLVVVVLTASNHIPEINRAYELGANSYLIKPVELGELVEIVRGMIAYWMFFKETLGG